MGKRVLWLVSAAALVLAACGNVEEGSSDGGGNGGTLAPVSEEDLKTNIPSSQPGVTDSEIKVGGVVSKTNPLGGKYDHAFKGVEAYFEMINSQGGLYGRDLKLAVQRDDQVANNQQEAQALVSQDNVFAVLPVATLLFSGAETFASAQVPTFGWTINQEWAGPPNLFGERGSYLCYDCAYPIQPWLADELGRSKVAVLAYNVPQSAGCAAGIQKSFDQYGDAEIVFTDSALSYGTTDYSVQVGKMKDLGVDFVTTCMDNNGVKSLADEIRKQELPAVQYIQQGYDHDMAREFSSVLDGSYVLTWFQPFEVEQPPPAMQDYFDWIEKVGGEPSELSMVGWLNADLFVRGLKAAGPEFTRQKVVDAINVMENWTADGLIPGVDWTIYHERNADEGCYAVSKIENGGFTPQFGEPGKPFLCFDLENPGEPDVRAGLRE
jgi:ABC-type branched-subunit amino acid transport system substrate-binding protein